MLFLFRLNVSLGIESVCPINPLESHGVRPLQGVPRSNDRFNRRLRELDLDPRQVPAILHRLHLLLRVLVEIKVELGRLLVVRPSIEVLS